MPPNLSNARVERAPRPGSTGSATATPKPLLASEVLRDELAPHEPSRRSCRLWQLGVALALALLGLAMRAGVGPPIEQDAGATLAFSAAGAVAAVALLPFPYAMRAGVGFLLGGVLVALGFRGAGPLAGLAVDGGWIRHAARLVTLCAVPAALLLRAHYRAYRRVRTLLAVALLAALPFVVLEAFLVLDASAAVIPRVAAGLGIAAVACAFFGFMDARTTGAGSLWAALILLVLPAEVALHELTPLADKATGFLTYPATALGVLCVGLLASLGLYQLLASAIGPAARRAAAELPTSDGLEGPGSVG